MNLKRMINNVRSAAGVLRQDILDFIKNRGRTSRDDLSSTEEACLEDLRRDGFSIVKGYWTREEAFKMRVGLEACLAEGHSKDYENGAYLRFWDDRGYDQGVRRLYHVERLVPQLKAFREDSMVMRIAAAYFGRLFHSGVLTFQHNTRSNANTRYYHIDDFSKQFKAFLYLDDVDAGNGPFTFLRGTQRCHWTRIKKNLIYDGEGSPTSFSEKDLGALLAREVQICAPAGTLILADVRGFHRGAPQLSRSRSILANYLYTKQGDLYLDK